MGMRSIIRSALLQQVKNTVFCVYILIDAVNAPSPHSIRLN
jgi:hypothetical protein